MRPPRAPSGCRGTAAAACRRRGDRSWRTAPRTERGAPARRCGPPRAPGRPMTARGPRWAGQAPGTMVSFQLFDEVVLHDARDPIGIGHGRGGKARELVLDLGVQLVALLRIVDDGVRPSTADDLGGETLHVLLQAGGGGRAQERLDALRIVCERAEGGQ